MAINFTCDLNIAHTIAPLDFEIKIDNKVVYTTNATKNNYSVDIDIDVDESNIQTSHVVEFVLRGKEDKHTIIDEGGKIQQSTEIEIKNIKLEDIDITNVFHRTPTMFLYTHNNNGHTDTITENFNFCMGTNGTAKFEFDTPVYVWLLENM